MPNVGMRFRNWCSVEAPARLHLGFLDLNGSLGRRFGSLGLTLEGLSTRVSVARAPQTVVRGIPEERPLAWLQALRRECGVDGGIELHVEQTIPQHAGLGSGTQLALAVGTAVSQLHGLDLAPRRVAQILGRGARSGIGIGAFERGGFIVDGGRTRGGTPPPVVSRLDFPEDWRVLLILDHGLRGLHGASEAEAFRNLPPFPERSSERLCRLLLMQGLPALAEGDIAGFGAAVRDLQHTIGDYFAPAQGGRYTSPRVARTLNWLEAQGISCAGQSSWGPTGFAIVESEEHARSLLLRVKAGSCEDGLVEIRLVRARNRGAETWLQQESAGLRSSTA